MEEMDLLDGNHKEKIQETLETHAFLQDIEKIKKIEKDIQERFDASFILDSDKLCTILHAIIKHIFDNRMLFRESGVSNIENEIIAMTKRMSLYGTMYNHDTSFILQAFEQ
jgi:6-pyruvoyl-tetrahydropterin synthase